MDCNIIGVELTLTYEDGKGNSLPIVCHEDTEGRTGTAVCILNIVVRLGWVVNSTSRLLYLNQTALVPMYKTLGATLARCEGVCTSERPFLQSGFEPRAAQPVASRKT